MNEVEDAVTAGVHPCNKVGPCHRTLRRNAGGERAKVPRGFESCEVGHLAFAHEAMQELRIHAIDAKNDQTLTAVGIRARGATGWQHRGCAQEQASAQYTEYVLQRLNP